MGEHGDINRMIENTVGDIGKIMTRMLESQNVMDFMFIFEINLFDHQWIDEYSIWNDLNAISSDIEVKSARLSELSFCFAIYFKNTNFLSWKHSSLSKWNGSDSIWNLMI